VVSLISFIAKPRLAENETITMEVEITNPLQSGFDDSKKQPVWQSIDITKQPGLLHCDRPFFRTI